MAEPGQEDQDDLKKKLVRRIAIAGVLVVVLLGGLTLVENYLVEQPAPPAPAAKPDAASVPDKAEGKPAEAQETEPKAEEKAAETPAEPEKTETPLAPAPEPKPSSRVVIKAGPAAPPAPPRAGEEAGARASQGCRTARSLSATRSCCRHCAQLPSADGRVPPLPRMPRSCMPNSRRPAFPPTSSRACMSAPSGRRRKPTRRAASSRNSASGPGLLIPPQKR
ncbi:MAG: hypothetical protein M5R42_07300 [Rhodocyclaceae bacterium]|nr:hypothetical protein [Rhodocyclaceae bacterium]